MRHDSSVFRPETYSTAEPRLLENHLLEGCFKQFSAWATANRPDLRRLLELHRQGWVREFHSAHVERGLVFSVEALRVTGALQQLATRIGVEEQEIAYIFDCALRYPVYGELAGADAFYLNHPVRKAIAFPTLEVASKPVLYRAISWAEDIARSAGRMSQAQYVTLLLDLREYVQREGYDRLAPGQFSSEVAREIATKVKLRPRVRQLNETVGVFADAASAVYLRPFAAVLESVSKTVWGGRVVEGAARVSWLRPVFKWDFEDQAEPRN